MNDQEPFAAFVRLVEQLRSAQREYFRTRGNLDECRKIERAVDRAMEEHHASHQPQRRMF